MNNNVKHLMMSMTDAMEKIAERPQMKDNKGIVAGGSVTAKVALTDDQIRMLVQQRLLGKEE